MFVAELRSRCGCPLSGWEEHRVPVVYKSVAKFSCGCLPRILSMSCLARKLHDMKDHGGEDEYAAELGLLLSNVRVKEVCLSDSLTVVHVLDTSLFPVL